MIGQSLGPYRILEEVAHGGQATLYRAEHTVLGRATALKVLHPHLITVADFLEKFEAESKILAKLSHPNIVAIYDAGVDQGQYWIAMEWLEGQTVAELITQQGKLPVDQAVRIADQVAAALEYAHSQGLIHRDIKPSNMMLLPDGTVKVLDFGIAAIVAAGQKAKTRIGTVEYMSYEQFQGQADHRSDLYSLGASLYEMLTGQLPPRLSLHPLTPPCQLNPAIPQELDRFLQTALVKEAENRPQTAQLFRKKMRDTHNATVTKSAPAIQCPYCGSQNRGTARYCRGCGKTLLKTKVGTGPLRIAEEIRVADPVSGFEPKFSWSPKEDILAATIRPSFLALFAFTQVEYYEPGASLRIPTVVAEQTVPEWSPDGTEVAYTLGEITLEPGEGENKIRALDVPKGGKYLHEDPVKTIKLPTPRQLTWGEDTDDDMPNWSPDGELLLYRSKLRTTGDLQWRLIDLTTKQILQTGEGAVQYTWSPNGDYFACAANLSRIEIYDRNGKLVDTYSLKQGYISQLDWLDNQRIFVVPTWTTIMALSEHALIVYDIKSKLSHKWLASSDRSYPHGAVLSEGTRVSVSPDRRSVAAIVTEWQQESQGDPSWQEIVLVRIGDETITKLQTTRTSSENITISGWSPDSNKVLFTRGEEIWTVNRNDTGLQRLTEGYAPQWSPDGRHIAFLRSPEQGKYELWVMRVEPA